MTIYVLAAISISICVCVYLAWRRRRPSTHADVPWEIDRVSPAAIAELKFSAEGGVAVCQVRYVGQRGFHTVASGEPARATYLRQLARCGTSLAQAASHYVSGACASEAETTDAPALAAQWPEVAQSAPNAPAAKRPVTQK